MFKYVILAIVVVCIIIFLLLRDKKPVSANAEIFIQAPLDRVWIILTDIQKWKNWNSDIESMNVIGDVELGTTFIWKAGGVTIESEITELIPKQKIAWKGKTTGISAYHIWNFSEEEKNVRVYTEERFSGILAWLLPGTMRNQISKALKHGVLVLKQEAEKESTKP